MSDEEDILTLRYTLLQYRKQLAKLIKNLFDIEFAYSKVELREDYNQLKTISDKLKTETNALNQDLYELMHNCQLLVEQTRGIRVERDTYYSEWQYAKDILTPRPDWDKCSDLIPNWMNLSRGKSSEELVNVIMNEIEPSSGKSLVRRRLIGLLVRDIWSNRLSKSTSLFSDYVHDYLIERFQFQEFQLACSFYRKTYEINLFWKILTGQIEENVYHYQMREYARILQAFIRFAKQSTMKSFDLRRILYELYPKWSNDRIDRLMKSIERDLQHTDDVEYVLLFMEDDEGHIGEFLRAIREELEIDKYDYVEQIKDLLIEQPLVSIKRFKQAVKLVDPFISKSELRRYINWVFEFNPKHERNPMRDFEQIINRLENCACYMHDLFEIKEKTSVE